MSSDPVLRFRSVGRDALLVEVADVDAAQATYRLVRRIAKDPGSSLAPPRDVVPASRTVLLDKLDDVAGWKRALLDRAADVSGGQRPSGVEAVHEVVIVVRYDGPDLDQVAAAWGCAADEVVRRHVAANYRVAFCGFAPGFAYCASDPPAPITPRRAQPRMSVPAGSVGLGGRYCGVYPRTMPGGWQLVGSTDAVVFDPSRAEPALLNPGTVVRFEPAA
jgi:KipI family sensor histidine kinase inhibitor